MGSLSTHTHMCVCTHFPHHHLHHYLDMQQTPFVHGLSVDGGKGPLSLGVEDSCLHTLPSNAWCWSYVMDEVDPLWLAHIVTSTEIPEARSPAL